MLLSVNPRAILSLAPTLIDLGIELKRLFDEQQQKSEAPLNVIVEREVHTITPVFGDYITRNEGFAKDLENVRSILRVYANRTKASRPLNILLAAAPGTGKSFLIKEMIKSLKDESNEAKSKPDGNAAKILTQDLAFSEYYVPAFRSFDDLVGVFNNVQSSNLKGDVPIVLFDEFDSQVAGRHILANLLAPMWDGAFYHAREKHLLGKSVFIFAGSTLTPNNIIDSALANAKSKIAPGSLIPYQAFLREWLELLENQVNSSNVEKGPDFIDRIDRVICIPPTSNELLGDDAEEEILDMAFILVQKNFRETTHVQKAVIDVLRSMLKNAGESKRAAEKIVFISHGPKDRRFGFCRLSDGDQEKYASFKTLGWDKYIKLDKVRRN